jgi:hypothetical protein
MLEMSYKSDFQISCSYKENKPVSGFSGHKVKTTNFFRVKLFLVQGHNKQY